MGKSKRINWALVGGLLGGLLVLGIAGSYVHGIQMGRLTQQISAQVAQAETDGKTDEGIAALERYLMLNPGHQESLAKLGKLLDTVANSPTSTLRALLVNEKVLSKDIANHDLRRRVIEQAILIGELPLAEYHLDQLLRAVPTDADAAARYGDVLLRKSPPEPDLATEKYRESIKQRPVQTYAYIRLALVYRSQKKEELANQTITAMVQQQPELGQVYLERGYFYQLIGKNAEAATDFKEAQRRAPEAYLPILASAELALARGQYEDARTLLEKGRKEHPEVLAWYRAGGELALLQNKPDEALAWIKAGQELAAGRQNTDLWHLRIEASRLRKDLDTVKVDLDDLQKLGTFPPALFEYLSGRYYLARGDAEKARRALTWVLDRPKESAALHARAAWTLAELAALQGQPDRQLVELHRAVRLDPTLLPATQQLARLLLGQGKADEALNLLRDLTQKHEAPPEAYLDLGRAWLLHNLGLPEERRNWAAPLTALQRPEKLPAYQVEVALLRADILFARGQAAEAEKTLVQAAQEKPTDARLWAARIALARRQGDGAKVAKLEADAAQKADDPLLVHLGTLRAGERVSPRAVAQARAALEAKVPTLPRAQQIALLQELGRTGDLERHARQLAELEPSDATNLIPALELALLGSDATLAAQIVKALRMWEGDSSLAARFGEAAWLVRSARRLRPELLDKARPALQEVLTARPGWAAPVAWLARLEDQAGRTPVALKLYRQAFDLGDRNPGLQLRLLDLLLAADDANGADQVFRQMERFLVAGGKTARLGAEIARRKGELERARQLANLAQPDGPARAEYLLWLAAFLNKINETRDGIAVVRQATDLDPNNPDGWVLWVQLLVKTNAKQQAEQVLALLQDRQAIDLQAVTLAQCEALLGRTTAAATFYEQALQRDPDDIYTLLHAAAFYLSEKARTKAKPLLERLRRLGPRVPDERLKWVEEQLVGL